MDNKYGPSYDCFDLPLNEKVSGKCDTRESMSQCYLARVDSDKDHYSCPYTRWSGRCYGRVMRVSLWDLAICL